MKTVFVYSFYTKPLKQDCIKFNRSMIIDIKCANLLGVW